MKIKNKHLAGAETLTALGSIVFDAEGSAVVSKDMAELLLQVPGFDKCDCDCGACKEEAEAEAATVEVAAPAPRKGKTPKSKAEE